MLHTLRKCRTPVWVFIFTKSGTGHLVNTSRENLNIYYQTVSDVHGTAICKHSLEFSIALVSFCTCTGSNMVMVQCLHLWVLGKSGSVYFEYNMRKLACIQASSESLPKRLGSFNILGIPIPKQTEQMENHTILCQSGYGTVHLCSGKINKYLSGSNRERSICEGMAVPESRTRSFKKLVRKELKYSMYKNTYSQ